MRPGDRVLLLRPEAESEALAPRVTALGLRPVIAPVLAIVPLPARFPAGAVDAVLATSAQAVAMLGDEQRGALAGWPAFAVGAATAAALRAAGVRDCRVGTGDAAGLRDLLRLTLPRPARLLYLAGRHRKPALEAMLAADGHAVTVVPTYDAEPRPWTGPMLEALRAEPPEAALHFSRRSAALAEAAAEAGGLGPWFDGLQHLCLSCDVADGLGSAARSRAIVANEPTTESLLQALAASLA